MLGTSIASIKAGLVAAFFMHLRHERMLVYVLIGIGTIHAAGLMIGTGWHYLDRPEHPKFYSRPRPGADPSVTAPPSPPEFEAPPSADDDSPVARR